MKSEIKILRILLIVIVIIFALSLFAKVGYAFLHFDEPLAHLQDIKLYYVYIVVDILLFILLSVAIFVDKIYLWFFSVITIAVKFILILSFFSV